MFQCVDKTYSVKGNDISLAQTIVNACDLVPIDIYNPLYLNWNPEYINTFKKIKSIQLIKRLKKCKKSKNSTNQ